MVPLGSMMIIASGAESRTLLTSSEESMVARGYPIRRIAYAVVARPEAVPAAVPRQCRMSNRITRARFVAFAWLPMGLAALGVLLDERRGLGYTIWRAACRASGFSFRSITTFTLELLPTAVIGALLGGLILLAVGSSNRARHAHGSLAAHLGCAIAMPAGFALCASPLPMSASLVMEITLAGLLTWVALHASGASSVRLRTRTIPRA
jgi:hypothetical protein